MPPFIVKYARPIAYSLLVFYVILLVAGLELQYLAGTIFSRTGTPVPLVPVIFTTWGVFGVLVVTRQPGHPVGWIFVATPVIFVLDDFAVGYAFYGSITSPGSLPFTEAAIAWTYWSPRTFTATCLTLLFLLFPTGRPMSRRWGKLAWASIIATIAYVLFATISPLPLGNRPFANDIIGANSTIQGLVRPLTFIFFSGFHSALLRQYSPYTCVCAALPAWSGSS